MSALSEDDVRNAAEAMGYELSRLKVGYELVRRHEPDQEVIVASTLELIADFLEH